MGTHRPLRRDVEIEPGEPSLSEEVRIAGPPCADKQSPQERITTDSRDDPLLKRDPMKDIPKERDPRCNDLPSAKKLRSEFRIPCELSGLLRDNPLE